MVPTNQSLKLPTQVRSYWITKVLLKVLVIYVIVSMFWGAADPQGLIGVFWLFIVIAAICVLWEITFYNSIRFSVADDKLTIDSGIITKRSTTIPYQNVQNVNTVRGIMRRMFDIATLNIWTASPGQFNIGERKGNEDAMHDPDGRVWLTSEDAQWVKDFIASKRTRGGAA